MKIAKTAMHTAYGCPLTGEGLLVCHDPADDMPSPDGSLHAWLSDADLAAMATRLEALGWFITREDDGEPLVVGHVGERRVVGLGMYEPVDEWDGQRNAEALDSLAASVGMTAL